MITLRVVTFTSLVLLIAATTCAQSAAPAPPPAAAPAPALPWWLTSPRAETPFQTGWRFHVESQGSLSRTSGNLAGYMIGTASTFIVRKGLVTNVAQGMTTIQDLSLQGVAGTFKQTTTKLTEMLMVNVVGGTHLLGGVFTEENDPEYIARRRVFFAGVGQSILSSPKQWLMIFVAAGHEDERFIVPGFEDNGPIVYLGYQYRWTITPTVGLRQSTDFIESLNQPEDYRADVTIEANVAVSTHLYLAPTFEYRYDNRTTPLALATDTSLLLAFRVAF